MLAKYCHDKPQNWYNHIRKVQMTINSVPPRSTKVSPFKLLTGVEMRLKDNLDIREILEEESLEELDSERKELRLFVRKNIEKIQVENCNTFIRKCKPESMYKLDDLVAIKRTQFGNALKLKGKFLGPYKITRVINHGRYEVEKIGDHEGPQRTISVAENMKRWNEQSLPI